MKIIKKSILDLSKTLLELKSQMDTDCVEVYFDLIKFSFTETPEMKLEDLQLLFNSHEVEGDLVLISFERVKDEIQSYLSYDRLINDPKKNDVVLLRKNLFWNAVKKHFKLPPFITYEHIPVSGSFLNCGSIWNFCYIFLSHSVYSQ